MASDHTIVVDGTDLRDVGAMLSKFAESLPEPKVVKVSIPAGLDLDITDSLGTMGYRNGKHTLMLYVNAETEAELMRITRELVSMMHGNMLNYRLSWDEGYTYRGRFAVKLERLNPRSSRVTIDIDRNPWKTHSRESVDVNCHPSATYTLEGSARFHTVQAILKQAGTTKVGSDAAVTRDAAGTYTLATDLYGNTTLTLTVSDWLMYVDESNLAVNENKISYSSNNAVIDSTYTVTNGNIVFADEAKQHVTVRFYRWDL